MRFHLAVLGMEIELTDLEWAEPNAMGEPPSDLY